MDSPPPPAPIDWADAYAAVGLEPPKGADELERDAVFDAPATPSVPVDPDDVAVAHFPDVNIWELQGRDKEIYEAGFFAGHLSRQHEVDAMENSYKLADDDANRYYRAAFDHDYHDCSIHENRGRYPGARTRILDDAWGDNWDATGPGTR